MIEFLISLVVSFLSSYIITKLIIPRLVKAGITGNDENKIDKPPVAEMGGFGIVAGLSAGVLSIIFLHSFFGVSINLIYVLAGLLTIQAVAFIGVVDDLISIPQLIKALLPLAAAIPLVAANAAGSTSVFLPVIGNVDFGIIYILILIPLAIAVCSNLTNMLAGVNGLDSGMGLVMFAVLAIIGINSSQNELATISVSMFGALFGFFLFGKYPAKVFPGDVGTLSIGTALAVAVIIGNLESAGVILLIPHIIDFFLKAKNKFPHTYHEFIGEKLFPKDGLVKGAVHLVLKIFNGLSEKKVVNIFIIIELFFGIIVLLLYLK